MRIWNILWIALAAANFVFQLLYFYRDSSRGLYLAKRITTPLLLFAGLIIAMLELGRFPIVSGAVLLAMGLGEIGIEGSNVVEHREGKESGTADSIIVLIAGVIFLLVNVFIGLILIIRNSAERLPVSIGFAVVIIALLVGVSLRTFKPSSEVRTQMLLYSIGLIILLAGVYTDAVDGFSRLGIAGLTLTISDSLVLVRMGAGFDKNNKSGHRTLLVFLIVILLLYYFYMWLLITMLS